MITAWRNAQKPAVHPGARCTVAAEPACLKVMGLITYRFGFGLKESERSVMSLGMGTRNMAAVFAGVLAIPNGDPRMMVMVVMWTLWSFILAQMVAPIYGKKAIKTAAGSVA